MVEMYHRYNAPKVEGITEMGKSMTHQEFKDECDINRIMARALKTGQMPMGVGVGRYGDFSSDVSFHEAQEVLIQARRQFAGLPSKVRDRFGNDPGAFLAWVHDEKNFDEAKSLGLLKDEAVKKVVVPAGTVITETLATAK